MSRHDDGGRVGVATETHAQNDVAAEDLSTLQRTHMNASALNSPSFNHIAAGSSQKILGIYYELRDAYLCDNNASAALVVVAMCSRERNMVEAQELRARGCMWRRINSQGRSAASRVKSQGPMRNRELCQARPRAPLTGQGGQR